MGQISTVSLAKTGTRKNNLSALTKNARKTTTAAMASSTNSTTSSSSGSTSFPPLGAAFDQIIQEAITGVTAAIGQRVSNKVSKFVSHRSNLKAVAQAAGWTTASTSSSSSSSSSTSSSSSSSSSSSTVNANDPITRIFAALGQAGVQGWQQLRDQLSGQA